LRLAAQEAGAEIVGDEELSHLTLYQVLESADTIVFVDGQHSRNGSEVVDALATGKISADIFRLFDAGPEVFELCFAVPASYLRELNRRIIALGVSTRAARVTSEGGTDLEIGFETRFGWIDSCGRYDGRRPGVLPPSEVATFSLSVNGVFFADGSLNTNFAFPHDPRLEAYPVRVEIEDSVIQTVHCENPFIDAVVGGFVAEGAGSRVGEVGFGTNTGIRRFVPFTSHINERYPALHIGLGSQNQGDRVGWNYPLHLDLIANNCSIMFDETVVMEQGRYVIGHVPDPQRAPETGYVDTV